MRIVLIGKNYILKKTLPKNIIENYYIKDTINNNERKLINVRLNNENYEIVSSNYSKVIDSRNLNIEDNMITISQINKSVIPNVTLEEYNMYPILINDSKEIFILYCLPDFEDNFTHIDIIETNQITIGKSNNNSIIYKNPLVADLHAKIVKFNGKWTIENCDPKYGVFVNNFPVYKNTKNIFNGDIIFIMGLEIIMLGDSFYINNPQKSSIMLNNEHFALSKIKNVITNVEKSDEEIEIQEYSNADYYSRSPKIIPKIKKEEIKIDEPPQLEEIKQKPMMLMLGSSIAMGVISVASLATTIQGMVKGTADVLETILGFLTTITMLIAMLIIPILDVKWDKKSKKKDEQKRQKKYKQYLNNKNNQINKIKEEQKEILYKNYLSASECTKVIESSNHRLWERKLNDDDFLSVRVGIGKVPLKIDITFPQEKFAMVDDNLLTALKDIVDNSKYIDDCPVIVSLCKNLISAIVSKDEQFTDKYIKNIILQLVTFHSWDNLKLVFLLNEKRSEQWQYVKMLPHVWDDSKQMRFFADNYDDMNELSKYLLEQLNNRKKPKEESSRLSPHYLIITDDYKQIRNLNFITELLKVKKNIGFNLLCISKDIYDLPSDCKTFIDIEDKTKGIVFEKGMDAQDKIEINIEPLITVFYEKVVQKLANIPVNIKKGATSLPKGFTFLDMYNVGNIQQLDILGRWKKNDTTLSLKAPIGIDNNGMIISLDAHEKFHGPHGLIAGSTGSGKSEFIITYILSLAVNYHPDDVTFLLIDYKGGGLAGAFQKNDIKLPHLVGTITNINKSGLKRSLVSIQSELRRRQVVFNEARNITDEGTIDIYKYQKLYHDGIVKEPISHLFIICDEFAELKQQQPEFMDELVSVSRIGRSLGVHLILATQKPSGVVDDQIRSNSKFGICLKVQDTSDSQDVILRPDAAYLKNAGQFYLKVGQNEYFVLGQSGWAGAPYVSLNAPIKKIDSSVEFISDIGLPIKKIDEKKQQKSTNKGEQLSNVLKVICNIANEENIKTKGLWLDDVPENIYLQDLKNKYHTKVQDNVIDVVIGEYDDPANQKQGLVKLDFTKKDNIIIYGNAESGKETLLSTMIYELMTTYSTEQVQMYILDFGTEALKVYSKSPHVGDVVFIGQDEKLETFFQMIQRYIKERKQILSNYNGDYNLYISKGNKMPIITIIINNYEVFDENYEDKYDDLFLTLTRDGSKCGIIFVVTASSTGAMRYRLTANFNKKIGLQLNDENDYYSIFDDVRDKRPTHLFGRGLISIDKELFEFQTAKICEHVDYNEHIQEVIEELNKKNQLKASPIPTLPKKLELEQVSQYISDISKVPIGLIKKNMNVCTFDFTKNFITPILSKNMADAVEMLSYIFEEIKQLENVKISILDAEQAKGNKKKAYNDFVKEIKKDIKNNDEIFTICAIIGIDKFMSEDIIEDEQFNEFLEQVKEAEKHSFIMIENIDRLQEHEYDDWFTNYIEKNNGIWIGNGGDDQTLIETDLSEDELDNRCGNSYGYMIQEGKPTLIKCIGIEEEGDEDE